MNGWKPSFDLIEQPWIAVRFLDGTVGEVSLRGVFERANETQEIAGELPTQDFAIVRLLLAILHRSLQPVLEPVREWGELWSGKESLAEYVIEHSCPGTGNHMVTSIATEACLPQDRRTWD